MKKWGKCILSLFVLVIATSIFPNPSYAASLPDGFLIGDETGFTAQNDGKYFIENNDIKPGITFTKDIVISNYAQEPDPISINLLMNPDDKEHVPESMGKVDLLEIINVKLTLDGKEIYDGLIDCTGKDNDHKKDVPLELGSYKTGETAHLLAEFSVASDLPEEYWEEKNETDFYWVFYATQDPKEEPNNKPNEKPQNPWPNLPPELGKILPQTGEEVVFVIVGMIVGLALILLAIGFYKMKRRKRR